MPVEVLMREEVEKIVEERFKKLLSETEIWKKIVELESWIEKLRNDVAKLSIKGPVVAQPDATTAAVTKDLAERADLLEIRTTLDSVTLKPKAYLGGEDFRAVREIVRKHGGFWSPQRRMFIVRKSG